MNSLLTHRFDIPGFTTWKGRAIDHFFTVYGEIRNHPKVRFEPQGGDIIDLHFTGPETQFQELVTKLDEAISQATRLHKEMVVA